MKWLHTQCHHLCCIQSTSKQMRIYLYLTPNTEPVPFNYQPNLVGALHKWLGENELHDDISLYSLSWLQGSQTRPDKKGFDFPDGGWFCISSPLEDLHQQLIQGILKDPAIAWGMKVAEVKMCQTPNFGSEHRFLLLSPVLIKRKRNDGPHDQYYFPSDKEADLLLTQTLQRKLKRFGLTSEFSVAFDHTYPNPKIKKINYRGLDIKATYCPVIVKGDPTAVAFVWDVGVGNSTGIGFGCLK